MSWARGSLLLAFLAAVFGTHWVGGTVLNPPYFNIAENRKITASATCGEGVSEPELYCKLVGANTDKQDNPNVNVIFGQVCDFCDPDDPKRAHPPQHAIDGTENWWQSPPLSRGNKYNGVNLTIHLGQEFHVAYVFIKMGNSPRPGVWILERSTDYGETYEPWQYFADTKADCLINFGPESLTPLVADDSVICETRFSKVVPLEGGEIVVSLLNDRPNADNFSHSAILQEWTKATNIRLRLLRTKTLLGHLMSVARQDPTVTRRYFYSIKDINIGGRCVCNGFAESCDLTDPRDPYKLLCRCQQNTCGPQCEQCCPGFQQKKWRRAIIGSPFVCEPCNCFGHSDECEYDEEVDRTRKSLDIHGYYEGGGVCKNCRHNTMGINCNQCKPTFYRPYGKLLNATDVCQACNCDLTFSTGNCADGNGQCECRTEFLPPRCDQCNHGYYGYPYCKPCDCNSNGTLGNVCEVGGGQCPCKPNYAGFNCDRCQEGFYGFPNCLPCNCNPSTSVKAICEQDGGQCHCRANYGGRQCDSCHAGYYNYPRCDYCSCDPTGCLKEICDNVTGKCLCKPGYAGPSCDRCAPGYFGYPVCQECNCHDSGSRNNICDASGRCQCLPNYSGLKCDQCSPGSYNFPECNFCNCEPVGSIGVSCSNEGECVCRPNFDGQKCDVCKEGFYNYPYCEECNCNPAGVLPTFLGCGSATSGRLCECKERVAGRICNECKPLYWNLKISNPLGCEDCNCYLGGTVSGIAVCARSDGQCQCKPKVGSRECSQCIDGTYQLDDNDMFGCKDCGCNIGGSVNNICDKQTGQCPCKPRITGRKCDRPLDTHYFPTLFQHQFEIEDGRTPVGTQVRYGYDENVFPGFSWRGYAVFSDIQKEVLLDIYIEKPSLYQVFLYYLNFGGENVYGIITFTPETFGDIQQSYDMLFEVTTRPKFMKVSGRQGLVASPFVLNPGRWTVSIRVEKPLFLDYMVLLPEAYYEATILREDVSSPCLIRGLEDTSEDVCLFYRYPTIPDDAEIVRAEIGYVVVDGERSNTQLFYKREEHSLLNPGPMALIGTQQQNLHLDYNIDQPGPYVMIVTYLTPQKVQSARATVDVKISSDQIQQGRATFYDCSYKFLCRLVVVDDQGEVAEFNLESNSANVAINMIDDYSDIAIEEVAFVPANLWHMDYVVPKPQSIWRNGIFVESEYLPVPESTKIEFESGYNEYKKATVLPEGINEDIVLINLKELDNVIDLQGSVSTAGLYIFVVHYYQPDHPTFEAQVFIQDGEQQHEAVLPLPYCPRVSGCRTVVRAKETHETAFQLGQNYQLNIRQPANKTVWFEYVLTIPSKEFHENLLYPLPLDKAGKFLQECGKNSFLLPSDVSGFCRESAFTLTSEYNNGALSCQCDTDGALSFECQEFGGACECKPHVIGRTCSQCRTGYFGFPNCKPCDCPSTAYCQPVTGQCICPPRVTGDRCDACVPYTYGFDPIIGCEECNCHPLGVVNGDLQCDLETGQCQCKSNVVGRNCNKCKAGYWAFPHCQLCNCDLRGSTESICDEDSARCYCKDNVYGDSCDQCKPGTFYLEEVNPLGCTKCFCFGTTDRCSSGYLFITQIYSMSDWEASVLDIESELAKVDMDVTLYQTEDGIQAYLSLLPGGTLFYFTAPSQYLGNKLSSYGSNIGYTLFTSVDKTAPIESSVGPDLILMGNNITIVHDHIEQPADGIPFRVEVSLIEHEFHHISGREVTREQMMMVLVNLEAVLIRGSYFQPVEEIKLTRVLMDTATDNYIADAPQALRVEQCHCPPSYKGSSCEECAPGYYRSKTGPYLGYCVPCQCNGHAQTCDVNTGKCIGCQHNTIGDHCEQCEPGYHGDSTQGTPYDCLICACPLPIASNNFAESCEVSPSGQEISCTCKPGYYGPRCEACDLGFFGQPEVVGSTCQPCQCHGNIDPSKPGSCDSVSGQCILCLNNTFGAACELCAPGFYGDAIGVKDCRKCDCDVCGTQKCDHETGECNCWPNVEGTQCDGCKVNHWGFDSCGGCRPCNCGQASRSEQCDLVTGQCPCQPGAGGLTCDICEPGFWRYSPNGCISCNCDEKYSAGAVCNPVTGQCQCLPGVLGDKCDSCPYRWVFVKNQGCLECDVCVHGLLDTTDDLERLISPVVEEMKDVSTSYFANKRLQNVNSTADTLRLAVDEMLLDPTGLDYSPLVGSVQDLEKQKDALDRTANHVHSVAETVDADADKTRKDALEVESMIREAIYKVNGLIEELGKLAEGLQSHLGPDIDNLIRQAENMLEELRDRNFEAAQNGTISEYTAAEELLDHVKSFEIPVLESKMKFEELNEKVKNLVAMLEDLKNNSQRAYGVADDAQALQEELQAIPIEEIIARVEENGEKVLDILKDATDLLEKAKGFIADTRKSFEDLGNDADRLLIAIRNLKDHIQDIEQSFADTEEPIREATRHAAFLEEQAKILDQSLANTRDSADAAVKAALAYGNIEEAINDAYEAAKAALNASDLASSMSEGVLDKTGDSKEATGQLLESAFQLEDQVTALEPRLQAGKDGVLLIGYQNGKTARGLEHIRKDLDKLPLHSLGVLAGLAANDSAAADETATRAAEKIDDIVTQLPDDVVRSKEVPKAVEDARQAIKAAHSYADRVASIVPDTNTLIDKASKKESALRIIGTDVSDKIAKLQQKVAIARTQANRIKLGVQFFENTTLQVRNPEGMAKAATYTHLSLYFRTSERYGLLAFVGNEKNSHKRMKRVLTDDYMALEIRGGYLVLVMDIGSGSQTIKHDTYVSDGKWHQAVVERTGKTCSIIVRSMDEQDSVIEGFLPGTYSVFNLDQKVSKFFIGGIDDRLALPDTIENYHFDGAIEDVEFGGTPIGLWDFVYAQNNIEGCEERNELGVPPSNGLRFSGSGYVILPRKRHQFNSETTIKMLFKTYAKDGLLFLIGKNNDFFALEMEDGHVLMKYELGSGLATLKSPGTYNDGEWHSLEAARLDKDAILKIDQVEVDSGDSPGEESSLSTTNQIFVGGYPRRQQPFTYPITNIGFEGCIMDMQISAEITDLNKNKEALGVVNGCPVEIARTVSFNNVSAGYIAMPPENLQKLAQLTFKFKTAKENGVIFYAANEDNSNYLFIGLHDGNIIMKSKPGGETRSRDVKYNDRQWHYVSATKALRQMRLDVDDFFSVEVEVPVDALVSTTTPMYFAGVPDGFAIAEDIVPYYSPFVGCLGDTTVNNIFQNFADTQDKMFASLASCPLEEPTQEATQEPLPIEPPGEPDIDEIEVTYTIATSVIEGSAEIPEGPDPTPVGQCSLPLPPRRDTAVKPSDGIRFGNTPYSRQQYNKPGSFMGSILNDSTFALEFKSSADGGAMFYVADSKHIDFVGLIMKEGKIIYVFNCGTGSAFISSQNKYNDGTWHRVVFSRQGQAGRLVIDDEEEVRGSSIGSANSVNVKSPFYIGGVTEEVAREAKNNLKDINFSFPGCIRNVEAQGELLTSEKPALSRNTTGCSSKVEEGTFFSSEGGYLVLYDKYHVGQRISITLDIKPRNLSGVLLAVHGRQDYLILQLIDGRIEFGVDNGAGPITASFIPTDKHYLCDGEFHTIQVVKSNNFVTLSVDGEFSEPGIGIGGVSSTDTKDPLYIGGIPEESFTKRGVLTTDHFAGCMRYLELDSKPQSLAQARVFGQVTLNTCPTI